MRKAFLGLAALALLLSGGVSFATQSAQSSLGPASVFTIDHWDIWLFPAELNSYPRLLSIELDSFPFDSNRMSFWGTWSDDEQKLGTIGAGYGDLFNQKDIESLIPALNSAIANNPLMSPRNSIPLPENKYHIFYARDIGPVVAGLHIARASGYKNYDFSDTIPEDAVKRQAHSGIWSVEAGASAIIGDNIYIQSGVGYQAISFSSRFELSGASPPYWEQVAGKDANGVRLDLRLFYGVNDELKIVPIISYNAFSFGYAASYGDTLHMPGSLYNATGGNYSQREFKGAIGAEYRPQKDIVLLGGISLEYAGVDISDSNNVWLVSAVPSQKYISREVSIIVLPGIQAGIEARLKKWLKLRFGAGQRPAGVKTKSEFSSGLLTEESENTSEFDLNFGLSFEFGRVTIDAQLNEDQPYNVGYLLSGNPDTPFTRLSLKYSY